MMADNAPPIINEEVTKEQVAQTHETGEQEAQVTQAPKKKQVGRMWQQVRKGRGPNKGFKVTKPMHLEYNDLGQPCGKWSRKCSTHVGFCIRKLSILHEWDDIPTGLLKTLWEDTVVSNTYKI